MFGNDVFGLCNTLGQVPFGYGVNTTAFNTGFNGLNAGCNTPFVGTGFNTGFNTGNFGATAFHPLYGYLVNRVPQNFINQGFVPQTFGAVNTLGGQQVLPIFSQGIGNVGYGFNPYTVANWNWTSPLGIHSQICR